MSMYESAYRFEQHVRGDKGLRWATEEEIKERLTEIPLYASAYPAFGLPVVCEDSCVYVNAGDEHGLIVGNTGSKKSRIFALPMAQMAARAGESVLINDPKGEIYARTSGAFEKAGYRVRVINIRDPKRSHGYSPLHTAIDLKRRYDLDTGYGVLNDMGSSIFNVNENQNTDKFWMRTAQGVFVCTAGVLLEREDLFDEDQISLWAVHQLANSMDSEEGMRDGVTTNNLINHFSADSQVRINMESSIKGSDKTFQNIMISYHAPMRVFYSQRYLAEMLSTPDIHFEDMGMEKTAVFLITPDEKDTYNFIVSMIVKQAYEALIRQAQEQENKCLPIRVNFILDEFSNMPAIPGICSMLSAARSRNIRFFLFVQSLHQLSARYGDDTADTIRGNCSDWVFLCSRELKLLEELSQLCGKNERTGEPLISVSQLQRLSKERGEALILCGRCRPYIAQLTDIDDYPFEYVAPMELPHLTLRKRKEINLDELVNKMVEQYIQAKRRASRTIPRKPETSQVPADKKDLEKLSAELEKRFDELFKSSNK